MTTFIHVFTVSLDLTSCMTVSSNVPPVIVKKSIKHMLSRPPQPVSCTYSVHFEIFRRTPMYNSSCVWRIKSHSECGHNNLHSFFRMGAHKAMIFLFVFGEEQAMSFSQICNVCPDTVLVINTPALSNSSTSTLNIVELSL